MRSTLSIPLSFDFQQNYRGRFKHLRCLLYERTYITALSKADGKFNTFKTKPVYAKYRKISIRLSPDMRPRLIKDNRRKKTSSGHSLGATLGFLLDEALGFNP